MTEAVCGSARQEWQTEETVGVVEAVCSGSGGSGVRPVGAATREGQRMGEIGFLALFKTWTIGYALDKRDRVLPMKTNSTSSEGDRSSTATPAEPDVPLSVSSIQPVSPLALETASGDEPVPIRSLFSFGGTKELPNVHEYRLGEEIAHSVSHGIGALLSIAAMVLCIVFAIRHGGGVRLVAALAYTIPMFLEYVMSTLYHALTAEKAKRVFKVLDHSFIYLYIAGTYTPFCLITLANNGGLVLCVVVWVLALIGVAVEAFWTYRPRWVAAALYLALGWCVVTYLPALIANLPSQGFMLLVAGGLCYTLGCVFYLMKKTPYMHFIFHLLVVAGSVFQFLSILLYVL